MRRLGSEQLAPPIVASAVLVIAGPLYGGEVVVAVCGLAAAAGLLTYLVLRQLKLRRAEGPPERGTVVIRPRAPACWATFWMASRR